MAKCVTCGKEIPLMEGFFEEAGQVYCEKCYAEKRWAEMLPSDRAKWRVNAIAVWRTWVREADTPEERKNRLALVKALKVPREMEHEIEQEEG